MDKSLRISIARLKEEAKTRFQGQIEPDVWEEPLSEEVRLIGPVAIDLEASWKDGRLWLKGRASGLWELQCCRCLTRTKSAYDVSLDATFEEDDLSDEILDGREEIRQALLLSVPTQAYCRTDCKGLCPQCGADRNVKDCGCKPPNKFKIIHKGKRDHA